MAYVTPNKRPLEDTPGAPPRPLAKKVYSPPPPVRLDQIFDGADAYNPPPKLFRGPSNPGYCDNCKQWHYTHIK
jgi:hypothetical protein